MARVREHNEYFRSVSMNNRKSCPNCRAKLEGEKIWSWGEYVYGRWNTVKYFCKECFSKEVSGPLGSHTDSCGCSVNLIGYNGETLPEWLR